MAEDLTTFERRLVLGAIWDAKHRAIGDLERFAEDDDDRIHIQETGETFDEAARKLGGDPAKDLYGAPEF